MLRFILILATLAHSSCGVFGQCENVISSAVIKGKKFFDSRTGEYIPIKGINYYPRPNVGLLSLHDVDFYTEQYRHIWERDIANFVKLNVNAIRIFSVDPGQNHDAFMCALRSAGIYAIIGLGASCENCAIGAEAAPACYSATLRARGEFVIHEFSRYENVLAFSAGNEANLYVQYGHPEINGPCQKKFIRDMRAYIKSCPSMRQIPVGVETADIDRRLTALYYNCRGDPNDFLENAEYYGTNVYVDCDGRATDKSQLAGFDVLRENFHDYNNTIPDLLTEFGCLNPTYPTIDGYAGQRTFLSVDALFSPKFTQDFAGGFVFEYSTELITANRTTPWPFKTYGNNNFGVGYFSPENCDDVSIFCSYVPFPQFDILAQKYGSVDTFFEQSMDSYNVTGTFPTCPSQFPVLSSFDWSSTALVTSTCPDPWLIMYCPGIPVPCIATPMPGVTHPPSVSLPTNDIPTAKVTAKPATAPQSSPPKIAVGSTSKPTASPVTATVGTTSPSTSTSQGAPEKSVTEMPAAIITADPNAYAPSSTPSNSPVDTTMTPTIFLNTPSSHPSSGEGFTTSAPVAVPLTQQDTSAPSAVIPTTAEVTTFSPSSSPIPIPDTPTQSPFPSNTGWGTTPTHTAFPFAILDSSVPSTTHSTTPTPTTTPLTTHVASTFPSFTVVVSIPTSSPLATPDTSAPIVIPTASATTTPSTFVSSHYSSYPSTTPSKIIVANASESTGSNPSTTSSIPTTAPTRTSQALRRSASPSHSDVITSTTPPASAVITPYISANPSITPVAYPAATQLPSMPSVATSTNPTPPVASTQLRPIDYLLGPTSSVPSSLPFHLWFILTLWSTLFFVTFGIF